MRQLTRGNLLLQVNKLLSCLGQDREAVEENRPRTSDSLRRWLIEDQGRESKTLTYIPTIQVPKGLSEKVG